jgi:hypothetical protein
VINPDRHGLLEEIMERLSAYRQETKRSRRRAKKAVDTAGEESSLHVGAVGVDVIPLLALDRPLVGALVAEDACWQIAVEAWQSRKPLWLHFGARRAWRAERTLLDAKRTRLRVDAAALGFQPEPAGHSRMPFRRSR